MKERAEGPKFPGPGVASEPTDDRRPADRSAGVRRSSSRETVDEQSFVRVGAGT
ncbi:hypothetical protein [Halostella pelagica]|uniref:hypothetical protein n=1 Tax=Halostella pelagica TaxID=2583824 RepID=UPI0013867353|nr:hypothetical protein [Halostella pelagica]